ncbi:porin family protein [Phenylobacterium sp. J367]|uniref:porin family protein n=1 Tax=Phenylobacterium sp. J367 TaxID=2898435 RepID=UPI002150AEAC|nr:porin family protein [Phenylobacterium sp. J367]MCR5880014.1 porin family protein [Phenylobacterium sp. J367]
MKILLAAASAAAMAFVVPAIAQAQTAATTGVYGGVGYAAVDADDVNLGALQGRLGYRFSPWLGVEGEAAFGVKDDDIDIGVGTDAKVELKHQLAAYAVGFAPLSENTDLIARIGYGTSKIKAAAAGVSASEDGDSFNFGVGAQHHFDGQNGVRVDWTRHDFRDDGAGHADVWSIGYTRKF